MLKSKRKKTSLLAVVLTGVLRSTKAYIIIYTALQHHWNIKNKRINIHHTHSPFKKYANLYGAVHICVCIEFDSKYHCNASSMTFPAEQNQYSASHFVASTNKNAKRVQSEINRFE